MEYFGFLPTELVVNIIERLDPLSLLSASATCKLWNSIATSLRLQYKVACHRYAVADGYEPLDDWPVHRRLEALKAYNARFSSLRWMRSYCFPTDYRNLWELFGGVYAQAQMGLGTIVFRKAMVTTTLEDERTWEVETGIPIRDFSMDVFQDLIVIVCYRNTGLERQVRFHSMSTGKDHPLARRPVVEIKATEPRLTSCNIAINNDVVGIIFQDQIVHSNQRLDANVLAVWAWKSGDLLLYLPSNLDNVVDSLSFLSPNHVLVGWRALFHREAQNMHEKSSLDVYDLSRGAEASPIKRFLLPELDEAATVLEFTICCDSTPTPSQHCPRPFYASPDHKICKIQIVFGYQLSGLMMRESPISLFLFTHVFLQEYGPSVTPPDETMETIIVPWDQWGNNTRTTLWNPAESVYNICVNGSRVIRKIPTNVPNRFKLQLCDFNPYAISSIESLPGKPTSNYRYVHPSHDNVLEMRVFKQKVYSPLPYLEITTKKSFEAHDVMLDHDNIYLVRTREIEVLSF